MDSYIYKIIYKYDYTVYRGTGYKPVVVNDYIENEIRQIKKGEGLEVQYNDFKIIEFVRVLYERDVYDDKMESKYSKKMYEIGEVINNSVIIKDKEMIYIELESMK